MAEDFHEKRKREADRRRGRALTVAQLDAGYEVFKRHHHHEESRNRHCAEECHDPAQEKLNARNTPPPSTEPACIDEHA